ncbi:MAG: hypothetical protein AABY22_03005 [Nanoarchaeota archaeon]
MNELINPEVKEVVNAIHRYEESEIGYSNEYELFAKIDNIIKPILVEQQVENYINNSDFEQEDIIEEKNKCVFCDSFVNTIEGRIVDIDTYGVKEFACEYCIDDMNYND